MPQAATGGNRAGRLAFALLAVAVFGGGLGGGMAAASASRSRTPVASATTTASGDPTTPTPSPARRADPIDDAVVGALWRRADDDRSGLTFFGPGGLFRPGGPLPSSGPGNPGDPGDKPGGAPWPKPFARIARGMVAHVPILMYHRIVTFAKAGRSLPGLIVPPDLFARQIHTLAAAGWHTITAATLVADLAAGRRPTPRSFVVTFDDGWYDGFTNALPILRRNRFVGTFYVITGRFNVGHNLSIRQMQAMRAAGNEIGDHTVNHVDLPIASAKRARLQIVQAAQRIQSALGVAPATFAYPFGGRSPLDEKLVAQAGLVLAVTTVEGCLESASNQFAAPRLRVGPGTSPTELLATMERCWALDK